MTFSMKEIHKYIEEHIDDFNNKFVWIGGEDGKSHLRPKDDRCMPHVSGKWNWAQFEYDYKHRRPYVSLWLETEITVKRECMGHKGIKSVCFVNDKREVYPLEDCNWITEYSRIWFDYNTGSWVILDSTGKHNGYTYEEAMEKIFKCVDLNIRIKSIIDEAKFKIATGMVEEVIIGE